VATTTASFTASPRNIPRTKHIKKPHESSELSPESIDAGLDLERITHAQKSMNKKAVPEKIKRLVAA
jgi:hypothetical protein